MDDAASLENLHDIVVPPPVPWWPPAPGWYWLALTAAVFFIWLSVRALRRHRAEAYRRAALAELAAISDRVHGRAGEPVPDADAAAALAEVPTLIKRTALAAYERERVAGLSGRHWWAFLDATANGGTFAGGAGGVLDRVAYGSATGLDENERKALLAAAWHWLRRHRRHVEVPPC